MSAPLQPLDPRELAAAVADRVEMGPHAMTTVAGPRIAPIRELAASWRKATGARAVGVPLPLVGPAGRGLRAGGLTDPSPDRRGETTFEDWLAERDAPGAETTRL